ncbi:MAG: hypothetical protein KIT62_17620, partial [Cyclobacteriaceae bacterium]|nr:hypothetical protein [Cyclobacteriaceae bacterium]
MKQYRLTILYAVFLFYSIPINAQNPVLNNVISPPPNVSAFTEGVVVNHSLYTGVPDISIPIYTVAGKKLQHPIVLSYHAAGNKVHSGGGWVGLGWSLQGATSAVTRVMRGRPDEGSGGYFEYAASVPDDDDPI